MPVTLSLVTAAANSGSSVSTTAVDVVISLAILALILWRQLQVRRASPTLVLPLVLIVLGAASLTTMSKGSSKLTSGELGILAALLVLDAVGLGALRAMTVKLWREGDALLRKGTWVTVGLWLVGIAIHEVVDLVAHIPSSSLLLYLGVTLLSQQLVLQSRVNRVAQHPGSVSGRPTGSSGGQMIPGVGRRQASAPGDSPIEDRRA